MPIDPFFSGPGFDRADHLRARPEAIEALEGKGYDVGNSLPNLFLCIVVHIGQAREAPSNPTTRRTR